MLLLSCVIQGGSFDSKLGWYVESPEIQGKGSGPTGIVSRPLNPLNSDFADIDRFLTDLFRVGVLRGKSHLQSVSPNIRTVPLDPKICKVPRNSIFSLPCREPILDVKSRDARSKKWHENAPKTTDSSKRVLESCPLRVVSTPRSHIL